MINLKAYISDFPLPLPPPSTTHFYATNNRASLVRSSPARPVQPVLALPARCRAERKPSINPLLIYNKMFMIYGRMGPGRLVGRTVATTAPFDFEFGKRRAATIYPHTRKVISLFASWKRCTTFGPVRQCLIHLRVLLFFAKRQLNRQT